LTSYETVLELIGGTTTRTGQTAAERRTTRTENVSYIIDVIPSNLPQVGQGAA
jgi:hypothetical protein